MNDLAAIVDRAIESPVAPPPSIVSLRAGVDRRQRVARRRGLAGMVATTCGVVLVVALVIRLGGDDSSLSVVGPTPDTISSSTVVVPDDRVPGIADRSLYSEPSPVSDGFALAPPGPYVEGQQVAVTVEDPRGTWDSNTRARQCAVVEGTAEICDIRTGFAGWQSVAVRTDVLGPDGLIPCDAPSVVCRITVGFEDTLVSVASEPIEVTGPATDSTVTITITDPAPLDASGPVNLTVDAIPSHPDRDALVAQLPPEEQPEWRRIDVVLCRFRRPAEPGYALTPWACSGTYTPARQTGLLVEPGSTSTTGTVQLGRTFYGDGGWQDCGANGCVLVVRRNYLAGMLGTSRNFSTEDLGATPIGFDPDGDPPSAATLAIDGSGPFGANQQVTIRGTGFPVGAQPFLSTCVPTDETSSLGTPRLLNCTYGIRAEVRSDGTFEAVGPIRCAAPDRRCLLTWIPGEGAAPYASVPFELAP